MGGVRALACESGARSSKSSLTQTCCATLGGYLTSLSLSSLRCCKTGDNSDIGGPFQCQVPAADPRPAPVEGGQVSRLASELQRGPHLPSLRGTTCNPRPEGGGGAGGGPTWRHGDRTGGRKLGKAREMEREWGLILQAAQPHRRRWDPPHGALGDLGAAASSWKSDGSGALLPG